MPWMASAWVVASWRAVETKFTLMATYFFVRRTGRTWSSIAARASAMFWRRFSPLTRATAERVVGVDCAASGAQAGAMAASRSMSRRVTRGDGMGTSRLYRSVTYGLDGEECGEGRRGFEG